MKRTLLLMSCLLMGGLVFADQVYYIDAESTTPTVMQTLEEKTQAAAVKTGEAVKSGAIKAGKATKKGAIKAGKATKEGAIKAGKATQKGAIKATNWSAKKVRDGAEKVIIKTEETPEFTETVE